MIDKYCTREQTRLLTKLGFSKGFADQEGFSGYTLLTLLPYAVGDNKQFELFIEKYQNSGESVTWAVKYYRIDMGGDFAEGLYEVDNESLAQAAADTMIWLLENNFNIE